MTSRPKSVHLDETAKRIIEQLQEDGRRSYAEIGKAVGLSEAAVRQRVQRLTESGVLQVVAVTDPLQVGFYRQAMIGIRVEGDTRKVAERLAALTEADYVFLLDPWWNPAAEAQAIDRTHRIGQTRPVNVYRLIAAGTIEQKVLALQQRKARLFASVMGDDDLLARSLTADDIRGLLET